MRDASARKNRRRATGSGSEMGRDMKHHENLSRRTFIAGSAIAAAGAGLALAGCTSSGGSSKSASGSGSASASSASASAEASSAVSDTQITAVCAYSSTNYTPIDMCGGSGLMIPATLHVFEGLYDLDLTTYTTYNALAANAPVKISDTEYEVTLRDAAKFSDGTDVTADDVVNAFEKNLTASTISSFLAFIDSVAKKDGKTVIIKLKYPFASLLEARLSLVKIFPKAKEEQLGTLPIGSGPWMYVEGKLNGDDLGSIEFAKNPYYTGSKPAKASSMLWNIQKSDATARVTSLQEGAVMAAEDIPDDSVDQLLEAGASVDYVQSFCMPFFMFNTLKEPLSDPRVRQAFYYAIDIDKLIADQMNGHATAAKSFLNENHPNFHQASNVFTYNPDKARELLAEAGVSDLSIKLEVNNNWVADLAPQIKDDLDAVGINTELETKALIWSEYAPSTDADGKPIAPAETPTFDVVLTPGDPSCFGNDADLLLTWWYSDNAWTNGRTYWKWAENSRFGEMQTYIQQARESANPTAQQDLWNKCFDLLSEEVPLYPLFHRQLATGYRADLIEGFKPIATMGLVFLDAQPK